MSWANAAGAAVSIGGSLLGSSKEKKAAKAAARTARQLAVKGDRLEAESRNDARMSRDRMAGAAEETTGRLDNLSGQLRADSAEARGLQSSTISSLENILSGGIEQSSGYNFIRDESLRGTERAASARGLNVSGNVLAALQERAGGVAASYENQIMGNLTNLLGTTGSITGTAAGQQASIGTSSAGIYSDLIRGGEQISANQIMQGQTTNANMQTGASTNVANAQMAQGQASAAGIGAAAGALGTFLGGADFSGLGGSKGGSTSTGPVDGLNYDVLGGAAQNTQIDWNN